MVCNTQSIPFKKNLREVERETERGRKTGASWRSHMRHSCYSKVTLGRCRYFESEASTLMAGTSSTRWSLLWLHTTTMVLTLLCNTQSMPIKTNRLVHVIVYGGNLPPIKGHGGLPCRSDLACATCDRKMSAVQVLHQHGGHHRGLDQHGRHNTSARGTRTPSEETEPSTVLLLNP